MHTVTRVYIAWFIIFQLSTCLRLYNPARVYIVVIMFHLSMCLRLYKPARVYIVVIMFQLSAGVATYTMAQVYTVGLCFTCRQVIGVEMHNGTG